MKQLRLKIIEWSLIFKLILKLRLENREMSDIELVSQGSFSLIQLQKILE